MSLFLPGIFSTITKVFNSFIVTKMLKTFSFFVCVCVCRKDTVGKAPLVLWVFFNSWTQGDLVQYHVYEIFSRQYTSHVSKISQPKKLLLHLVSQSKTIVDMQKFWNKLNTSGHSQKTLEVSSCYWNWKQILNCCLIIPITTSCRHMQKSRTKEHLWELKSTKVL